MTALSLLQDSNKNLPAIHPNKSLDGSLRLPSHVRKAISHEYNARLVELQRITAAARKVFNPFEDPVVVFKDCSTSRTYVQIGKRLEFFTTESLEYMAEPRKPPHVEPIKI